MCGQDIMINERVNARTIMGAIRQRFQCSYYEKTVKGSVFTTEIMAIPAQNIKQVTNRRWNEPKYTRCYSQLRQSQTVCDLHNRHRQSITQFRTLSFDIETLVTIQSATYLTNMDNHVFLLHTCLPITSKRNDENVHHRKQVFSHDAVPCRALGCIIKCS